MDLNKENLEQLASMVHSGSLEIDEIPRSRREGVLVIVGKIEENEELERIKTEKTKKKKTKKKKTKKKKKEEVKKDAK